MTIEEKMKIAMKEGENLLRNYIEIKKEGPLVDFCKLLILPPS